MAEKTLKYSWNIIGHEKQLGQIESDIASGNLAHAYLLSGPNSVGKYTVAKKIAGILQCSNDFCHSCPTCIQIEKGCHVDTMEFINEGSSVGIDEIKGIIERLQMTPQSNYKILLIQSIERLTPEAANSFLKILEEPPRKTIILLTTNNVKDVLPTLISRVRMINFGVVSIQYLEKKLKELFPDSEDSVVKQISLLSMGMTGNALKLMQKPDVLDFYLKTYRDVQRFLDKNNISDRFLYITKLIEESGENKKNISIFLSILTHVLRSRMMESPENELKIKYANALLKIEDAGILLKRNVNLKLLLENLMLYI